jgi:hypothetical protein
MKREINKKIKLLWNEIRQHCKNKKEEHPKSYWWSFLETETRKRIFAISILKELKGKI